MSLRAFSNMCLRSLSSSSLNIVIQKVILTYKLTSEQKLIAFILLTLQRFSVKEELTRVL